MLERMVFYGQTGRCRWKVLLDNFDESEGFVVRHVRQLRPHRRRLRRAREAKRREDAERTTPADARSKRRAALRSRAARS